MKMNKKEKLYYVFKLKKMIILLLLYILIYDKNDIIIIGTDGEDILIEMKKTNNKNNMNINNNRYNNNDNKNNYNYNKKNNNKYNNNGYMIPTSFSVNLPYSKSEAAWSPSSEVFMYEEENKEKNFNLLDKSFVSYYPADAKEREEGEKIIDWDDDFDNIDINNNNMINNNMYVDNNNNSNNDIYIDNNNNNDDIYIDNNNNINNNNDVYYINKGENIGEKISIGNMFLQEENEVENFERIKNPILPPRKLCPKGNYDIDIDACVYYDKKDKVLPIYKCPMGSVLDGNYCFGRITSSFELQCHKNFDANFDEICIRVILYTPKKVFCPEGFVIKTYVQSRVKQCIQKKYAKPIRRRIETEIGTKPIYCNVKEKKCNKIHKAYADKKYILECPNNGKLIKIKHTHKITCLIKIVVPPEPRESCITGYHWSIINPFGAACVRIWAEDVVRGCPKPMPVLLNKGGSPHTPMYKYDPIDNCVAYKAKAKDGVCPFGYTRYNEYCYRKYILPYYTDCNNLEGYAFKYNKHKKISMCEYKYNSFKWLSSVPHNTIRQKIDATRIHIFSNPYDVKRAYDLGETVQ